MSNDTPTDAVTGAFGYSGSRIAERLLESGRQVRTLTFHPGVTVVGDSDVADLAVAAADQGDRVSRSGEQALRVAQGAEDPGLVVRVFLFCWGWGATTGLFTSGGGQR